MGSIGVTVAAALLALVAAALSVAAVFVFRAELVDLMTAVPAPWLLLPTLALLLWAKRRRGRP